MQLTHVAPIALYNGRFLPLEEIKISPLDRGFIFGEGMYTTLACQNKTPLFIERHLKRLSYQIKELYFPTLDYDLNYFVDQLLALNELTDAAVYIHITRGVDVIRDHLPSAPHPTLMIIAMPWIRPVARGVARATVLPDPRWSRCDYKITSLIGNVQSSQQVHREGFQKVIYHRDSLLTEAAQANLFIVKDQVLKTPPPSPYLLNGVTRQILLEEANKSGIQTEEVDLTLEDLFTADEVFLTASLSQIVSITQIDDHYYSQHTPFSEVLFDLYEQRKLTYIHNKIKKDIPNHAS